MDVVIRKSKLQMEIEASKKRPFSEISKSEKMDEELPIRGPVSKRLRLNEGQDSSFMQNVIKKRSRIEVEKEQALEKQLKEKEKQLKNINQKGLVMKFDVIQPRSSKSPSANVKMQSAGLVKSDVKRFSEEEGDEAMVNETS